MKLIVLEKRWKGNWDIKEIAEVLFDHPTVRYLMEIDQDEVDTSYLALADFHMTSMFLNKLWQMGDTFLSDRIWEANTEEELLSQVHHHQLEEVARNDP